MKYHYPMLTEMEIGRQFIIDSVPLLHGQESIFKEHGFSIEGSVKSYLYNEAADINHIGELDELVLDVADILKDIGHAVEFSFKGYTIDQGS